MPHEQNKAQDTFVVVAGKYEGQDGRNYKYSGPPLTSLDEAIDELIKYSGYPFSEIEVTTASGRRFIMQAWLDTNEVLT